LFYFTWRDIKARYKQILLRFFGRLAKMPSDNIPYPIFSYAGLLP